MYFYHHNYVQSCLQYNTLYGVLIFTHSAFHIAKQKHNLIFKVHPKNMKLEWRDTSGAYVPNQQQLLDM